MRKKEQQKGREEGRERRMYIAFFSVLGIIAVFCVWRLYIIYFVQYGASAASYREVREAALEEEGLRAAALLRTDPPDTPEELDVQEADQDRLRSISLSSSRWIKTSSAGCPSPQSMWNTRSCSTKTTPPIRRSTGRNTI